MWVNGWLPKTFLLYSLHSYRYKNKWALFYREPKMELDLYVSLKDDVWCVIFLSSLTVSLEKNEKLRKLADINQSSEYFI